MHWTIDFDAPAMILAIALAAGMVAQVVARHLRLPGIVLLLGTGLLLGPDVLGIVRPGQLGGVLEMLVGFAVAVILFDGGMNLDLKRLRRSASSIRGLITVGALVTWIGGALAARYLMDWPWRVSVLFGSLVIVTGPTVVNPLLRRLRVKQRVATILEAEGVLIDAIGAITAVVALEVAFSETGIVHGIGELALRLGFGALLGAAFGLLTATLLKLHKLIPEGLENMLILALVLVCFQVSNELLTESGLVTVTLAGLVVGNVKSRALDGLREFKEELATLLIGMLFVILAADVRVEEVLSLGWRGVATVAALMLIVRPINVWASTIRSSIGTREKVFMSWLAPRGIVAAAVASLFAQQLQAQGVAEASQLRALVFLVIACTVLLQGLTGAPLARALGLRRPSDSGYVILGANSLSLELGRLLRSPKHEVLFMDSSPQACKAAEDAGFRVLYGNAMQESVMYRAQLESRAGCIAVTPNAEVNLLFARQALERFKVPRLWVGLRRGQEATQPQMLVEIDGRQLFGAPRSIDLWSLRLDKAEAVIEIWQAGEKVALPGVEALSKDDPRDLLLPMAFGSRERTRLFDDRTRLAQGDLLWVAIVSARRSAAESWLRSHGLAPAAPAAEAEPIAP